ncbi:MAG: hypothetical protein QXQ02_05225 [Halobacteria archaeon]
MKAPHGRRDYERLCRSPVNLLASDILRLANFFGMKQLEVIATFCRLVSIDDYVERLRHIGVNLPSSDLKIYTIQIKARRYCIFYSGESCILPLKVRPKQCIVMTEAEKRAFEAEKHAFYLELAELIPSAGSVEKALELYLKQH